MMGNKSLFRLIKAANLKYDLVENGDRIAVGVSGGKDSLVLLYAFCLLSQYTPLRFEVIPVSVDLGWGDSDWSQIADYCRGLSLEHRVIPTRIGPLVFRERQESNPCALCSNLRAGCLNRFAVSNGCNKVALAHHLDDALATLFLSMVFSSQFRTFKPKTDLDRAGIKLIRPLIYVEERSIASLAGTLELPVMKSPCPAAGTTNREKVGECLKVFDSLHPRARRNMLRALENADQSSFWFTERLFPSEAGCYTGFRQGRDGNDPQRRFDPEADRDS